MLETLTPLVLRDGALGGNGLDETMKVGLRSDRLGVPLGACSPSLTMKAQEKAGTEESPLTRN